MSNKSESRQSPLRNVGIGIKDCSARILINTNVHSKQKAPFPTTHYTDARDKSICSMKTNDIFKTKYLLCMTRGKKGYSLKQTHYYINWPRACYTVTLTIVARQDCAFHVSCDIY